MLMSAVFDVSLASLQIPGVTVWSQRNPLYTGGPPADRIVSVHAWHCCLGADANPRGRCSFAPPC